MCTCSDKHKTVTFSSRLPKYEESWSAYDGLVSVLKKYKSFVPFLRVFFYTSRTCTYGWNITASSRNDTNNPLTNRGVHGNRDFAWSQLRGYSFVKKKKYCTWRTFNLALSVVTAKHEEIRSQSGMTCSLLLSLAYTDAHTETWSDVDRYKVLLMGL